MREQIEKLLNSEISTSAIAKGAGVPWSTVADVRKGKAVWIKWPYLLPKNCITLLKSWRRKIIKIFNECSESSKHR